MVKSENAQLLIGGEPVESDYTFTAKDSSMEVQIAFTFNASELAGKDLVTFEELYDLSNPDEPTKVAEHKDIEDEGQTVTITERIITMHTIATAFNVLGMEVQVSDDQLSKALKCLPERKRNIILLSYFMDMSDAEIGELMNVVRTTVYRHRTSTLEDLRKMMEEE